MSELAVAARDTTCPPPLVYRLTPAETPALAPRPARCADSLSFGEVAEKAAHVGIGTALGVGAAAALFRDQPDKLKHAAATAVVSGVVSEATGKWWAGVGAAIVVGVAKELADGSRLNPHGTRDFRLNGDLGADLIGAVTGSVFTFRF